MAIITLTGIALGIILGASSSNIDNFEAKNNRLLYQGFTQPAIASLGTIINSDEESITVSFENHPVRLLITEDTLFNKIKKQDDKYIFIKEKKSTFNGPLINKDVYITYLESENKLFADKIHLLR